MSDRLLHHALTRALDAYEKSKQWWTESHRLEAREHFIAGWLAGFEAQQAMTLRELPDPKLPPKDIVYKALMARSDQINEETDHE